MAYLTFGGEQLTFGGIDLTFDPVIPISKWSRMDLIPKAGLEAWNALDNAVDGTEVDDYSGNFRTLAAAANAPALQTISKINYQPALYFDGTNSPLQYTGNFTLKHLFFIGSVETAAFENYAGLFTGTSGSGEDILVGNPASDRLFLNPGLADFTYKKNDAPYPDTDQKAPTGGRFGIIEFIYPAGASMEGMTIGRQRALPGTELRGWFAESIAYSRVLDSCERIGIYHYLAMKFFTWREDAAGRKIFPFVNDKKLAAQSSKSIFESVSISGAYRGRSNSDLVRSFDALYGLPRRQEEYDAAEEFANQCYPGKPVVFEDNSVYPPKPYTVRMTSMPQRDSDNYFHSYKASFTTVPG